MQQVDLNLTIVELIRNKPTETLYYIYLMMSSLSKAKGLDITLDDIDESLDEYLREVKLKLKQQTFKKEEMN